MHGILWKQQAINDLTTIGLHIAKDSPTNAAWMIALIEQKVAILSFYPFLGHAGRKPGTCELVVHENYIVIYRVVAKQIHILRVKHAAQKWPPV